MARTCGTAPAHLHDYTPVIYRAPGHVQRIGRPCSTWLQPAMTDVKMGVTRGRSFREFCVAFRW